MKKILLVEDNEIITKGLRYSLNQENFEVEIAKNIVTAKAKMKKQKFDLYLLDILYTEKAKVTINIIINISLKNFFIVTSFYSSI